MLKSGLTNIVTACTRHARLVLAIAALVTGLSTFYAARHFAINTDVNRLISQDLPWRQREIAFDQAFPGRHEFILAVLDAPTPELASEATAALLDKLRQRKDIINSVQQLGGGEFFSRNGLLFLPTEDVQRITEKLTEGSALFTLLASDPSLRGLGDAVLLGLTGVKGGQLTLDAMAPTFDKASATLEDVEAGRPAFFSWRELVSGKPATTQELRRLIEVKPILDYGAVQPGAKGSEAIRQAAKELDLAGKYATRVRLTGPVPVIDEEFATVQEGAIQNGIITVVAVLIILWLALRSGRIIAAVFLNLAVGLAVAAAAGFLLVGTLNLISVAFFVLFVGLGVDFGIQFAVRYRSERYETQDLFEALRRSAQRAGMPLTLAAAAVAAGFFSFTPTDYLGLSELGLVAGIGMIVAFLTSITVLPALLTVLNPPGEAEPLGYAFLAPVDDFLERHRVAVIVGTLGVAILGLPLLYHLRFDFNPLNLRDPHAESISTFLDLRKDPKTAGNAISLLAPSLGEAEKVTERVSKLPEVDSVMTVETFVPKDQERKLELIAEAREELGFNGQGEAALAPPTDEENVAALGKVAGALTAAAGNAGGRGPDAARRLATALTTLAKAPKALRDKAEATLVDPLKVALDELRTALQAEPVTLESLPAEMKKDWLTADGKARVDIVPKGDQNDNEVLRNFARTVLAVEPGASGGPISILESGHTVVRAFIEAGVWALLSIAILLWIALRRFTDVLLTLLPLILAGVVTLEICVLIGMPLNFANIIALPLLLGVGVAFKIYYITAWRGGQTKLLESPLTRAVFFSAMTTATAFGSLWLSSHPGTSSMGKLMALSLVTTLAAAVLFQPALMGKPRQVVEH